MRTLPQPLADALASGVTTLARAWAVTRRDGTTLGFTDHDRALSFEGIAFEAASGFTAEAMEQSTGLAVDTAGVEGALQSDAITDLDLERGLYDGAEVRLWLVDWSDVTARVLLSRGSIGEVRRGAHAFEAEVAGLAQALNRVQGRAYLRVCDRRLSDGGCGVDLTAQAFRGTGTVTAVLGAQEVVASGLGGFASGWFDRGALTWTTGPNGGATGHVKAHRPGASDARLTLWRAPAAAISVGDAFEVTAGCDKSADTCREKFANLLNFGGFPLMPGDDWVAAYPNTGEPHDGGSLFR